MSSSSKVEERIYRLELKGVPVAQARPRRGNGGDFYNPNCRAMAAFKAAIKGGISISPIFGVEPIAVNIKLFMRPYTHFISESYLFSEKLHSEICFRPIHFREISSHKTIHWPVIIRFSA